MELLASVADVEKRLARELTDLETDQIDGLLEESSVFADSWMDGCPLPVPDQVRVVVSRMVARVLDAPDDVEPNAVTLTDSAGVFSRTRTYSDGATAGGPWLTKADRVVLRRFSRSGRAVSVNTW